MNLPPVGHLPQGTVLYQGRFRIDLLLASAPQRAVYRAWDLTRDRAATILELATPSEEQANAALQRAAPLVQLDHPTITPFQVIFVEQNTVFIGMGLPGGQTLDRIMAERSAPITPAAAVRWIVQAAEALEFLARELPDWHLGDVSAAALLVTAEDRIQLLSFELPLGLITPEAIVAHLPPCMVAPELRYGLCDARSDVYALAATLHLLLTRRAWMNGVTEDAESLSEQRPDLPRGLIAALVRGLADDPAQRWPDPAAFYHALIAALPGDQPSADWWLVRDSALTELEEPPTLVTSRDQLRAAVAAEAAKRGAMAPPEDAPGAEPVAPEAAPAPAESGVFPVLPPLEYFDEPQADVGAPPPPPVAYDPFVALNQPVDVISAPTPQMEDAQALLADATPDGTETPDVLDIAPLLIVAELTPSSDADVPTPKPAPDPAVPVELAPSRGDYAAAPLGEIALGALPVAGFFLGERAAAEPEKIAPEPAEQVANASAPEQAKEQPQPTAEYNWYSKPAPPEPDAAPEPTDIVSAPASEAETPAPVAEFVPAEQPPITWLAPEAPADPVAPQPEQQSEPEPGSWRNEQLLVAHSDPASEPARPQPQPLIPTTPAPVTKTPTRPQGMLGKLRALMQGSGPAPTRATGTIVVPRHMYPHHNYAILVRLQCPPELVAATGGEAPVAIVELETTTAAFYAPVRRLALRIPIEGGTTEGSLTVTALRPSPGDATDRLVIVFRAPDGRALHQGHFIAEVAILSPQQGVSGDPMIALVHALDLA